MNGCKQWIANVRSHVKRIEFSCSRPSAIDSGKYNRHRVKSSVFEMRSSAAQERDSRQTYEGAKQLKVKCIRVKEIVLIVRF